MHNYPGAAAQHQVSDREETLWAWHAQTQDTHVFHVASRGHDDADVQHEGIAGGLL